VIGRFLPELLPERLDEESMDGDTPPRPGSRVNITEGDDYNRGSSAAYSQTGPKPVVVGAQPDDSEGGLGNISDLLGRINSGEVDSPKTGMDHNDQEGYNGEGGIGVFSASPLADSSLGRQAASNTGGNSASMEALPDLDSMAGVFSPASGRADSDLVEHFVPAPAPKPAPLNRGQKKSPEWAGDFNPKDLAEGLRTILNKEKEG